MKKTPKLRFKEFRGDWESKKLGEMGEFKKTYAFSRSVEGPGNYKHIHYGDVHMNYKGIISKDKFIPSIDIPSDDKYEVIKEKDIIFADASEDRKDLGKVAVVRDIEGNVLSGLHTFCFRPEKDLNSEFFLGHSLNKEYLKFMYTRGNGAKVLGISKSNLSEYKFLVPSEEEQEKIASFFSLIDNKISLQGEKVEALKDYKKGMMQKIFSRELRFKDDDGRDYPEWKENKLCNLIKIKSNRNKNSIVDLVLSVSNTKGFIIQSEQFEDRVVASSDISNYKVVENDDFAFNPARINVGSIARLKLYDKGIISPMYICFKCLDSLESDYLEYFLMTHSFDVQMKKKLEGSVRQTLSAEALGKIVISLPCLDEQKKVGSFLDTINNKLVKEQEKLDSLNEYKKGLLQQMFI